MLTILLAEPRGFCAGVSRAIQALEKIINMYKNETIYVLHEIVHNAHVLDRFHNLGVIFTEDINEVPNNSILIFSAHGISKKIEQIAKTKNLRTIDATCPLVKKTHKKIISNEKNNKHTILIGSKTHPEIIGTSGRIDPENVTIIKNHKELTLAKIPTDKSLEYITQTTLSVDDTINTINKLKEKFPTISGPGVKNICYATQNRQNAVKLMATCGAQLLLVVGAKNSSNSNKLCDTGTKNNITSYLIANHLEIQKHWLNGIEKIGITAGASTPDDLINNVIKHLSTLSKNITIQHIVATKEYVKFKLPELSKTLCTT
ncbi:4-hydroxy-3-methylbut-2-enyl diphosphate reductase [Candidatus Xenohaliotis californiensis]|uniref:4-hydroxy-3-methylbut-2-enyl diphosphate reductase n=1 Tax=Candidatus Xenohaliotis californiensis TaxID=84677 RepID=A0ABP0EXK3_9RICK|nr:4-hydroxy-3-methylbut-2-enyl diphosphate reductase [Candidatus Xenohaliotis californiensis]